MTLPAWLLVTRARWITRTANRERRRRLERELAHYSTDRDRADLEAILDRYPDGATHEIRSILARQALARQESRWAAFEPRRPR